MIGDYMNYNDRSDAQSPVEEEQETQQEPEPPAQDWKAISGLAKYAHLVHDDDEDGYDPYNHPIDRRFLE